MELHHRVELIDAVLEEAEQKMTALHHALGAQARAKEEMQHAGNGSEGSASSISRHAAGKEYTDGTA